MLPLPLCGGDGDIPRTSVRALDHRQSAGSPSSGSIINSGFYAALCGSCKPVCGRPRRRPCCGFRKLPAAASHRIVVGVVVVAAAEVASRSTNDGRSSCRPPTPVALRLPLPLERSGFDQLNVAWSSSAQRPGVIAARRVLRVTHLV